MIPAVKPEIPKTDPVIDAMTAAGLQFGHKTSKTHPRMKPFVSGVRNTVHMIDLEKTKEKLAFAAEYLKSLKIQGKVVLLVGTKIQHRQKVREVAIACGMPYVIGRWVGGMITNFATVSKRLERFKELELGKESGDWEKYTKKEKSQLEKELRSLNETFGGLKAMIKVPDALLICDVDENALAAKEARQKGIPVVAIVDTNIDPELVSVVIPANDDAVSSVAYILDKIQEIYVGSTQAA